MSNTFSFLNSDCESNQLPEYFFKLTDNCSYHADVGIISPLKFDNGLYCIEPFNVIDAKLQSKISVLIREEWPEYTEDFIIKNFTDRDILYVCYANDEVIGCVAVDRKRFFPFISTLYVAKSMRKKGYAESLINFAEAFIKEYRFDVSHLWCKSDSLNLINYYKKFGYVIKDTSNDVTIMIKSFQ